MKDFNNKELEILINEKYDQLNKDLFDFKDTLKLIDIKHEKKIHCINRKIDFLKYLECLSFVGFCFLIYVKKK